MSETIKLGDTVRFQAIITHPVSGYVVNADSNVRYYAFINDSDTIAKEGDMTLKSGFTGLYRGSFDVTQANTFASGQYVSIKASGTVGGYTGWGNIKEFIVSDISLSNMIQWSGVGTHPDNIPNQVWNYGGNVDYRQVNAYSIGGSTGAAYALSLYWQCVSNHVSTCLGGTSNTIVLANSDTYAVTNIASGTKLRISNGTGEGQFRTIIGFVTTPHKIATVSENWITIPISGDSQYIAYEGESNQRYYPADLYYANIKYTRKNTTGAWQDNFSSQWYKNGSVVTSGQLTNPRLSLYNTIDGTVSLNNVSMSYSSPVIGSTYYTSNDPSVTNSGIPYMVAISGTIDGSMRIWNQIVGIDLL